MGPLSTELLTEPHSRSMKQPGICPDIHAHMQTEMLDFKLASKPRSH